MPTSTTNFGLSKPLVNDATDQDLWGGYLNTDLDSLDALIKTTLNWTPNVQTSSFSVTAPTAASTTTGSSKLLYLCNATSGAITVSLPAASTCSGMVVAFKKTDSGANAITIDANSTETIDGALTQSLSTQYNYMVLSCDGTGWNIISQTPPSVTVPILRQQVVTAIGSFTFTAPSNTVSSTVFKFIITGAGGSGGEYSGTAATGGAAGGTCIAFVSGLVASQVYSGSIGAGGAAVSSGGTPGNNGGNTTFVIGATTYTANGGAGGVVSQSSTANGGTATNGTINITGGDGVVGAGGGSGCGGGSYWGSGGAGSQNGNAHAGQSFGSGGGPSGSATSGAGANGIFVAEWVA